MRKTIRKFRGHIRNRIGQVARFWRDLWEDRSGGATLEVAVVTAVLVAIALIFNQQIREYAKSIFAQVFNKSPQLDPGTP